MLARRLRIALAAVAVVAGLGGLAANGAGQSSGIAYSIELPGTIDPATERWIAAALEEADEKGAEVAIIRLDTPGGLDSSMRSIVQDIIEAPMPVIVYVSPDGARAASAGLFVTEAADVAAMAPQTNIGSATPISLGGGDVDEVLGRKVRNDAAAYVRALASEHGRNPELAERMVQDAVNVTASEALDAGLIDVIASSQEELLAELDGFQVEGPKAQTLDTEGLVIEERDMPFQYDLLQLIVNPTISYLLLIGGMLGIAVELFSGGGLIAPGVLGAISFLLGLYGTALLPVTAVGIALLLIGIALVISEAHMPTHGILGVAGVIAIVASGILLYNTDSDAFEVSIPVVVIVGLLLGGFVAFAAQRAVAAHRRRVMTGWEELIGAEGEVRVPLDPVGQVFVEGALWRARPVAGDERIEPGYRVRVESVDGLTLSVRRLDGETGPEAAVAAGGRDRAEEGAG